MLQVILSLLLAQVIRGIPVATTADAEPIRLFKKTVVEESSVKVGTAHGEAEALLARRQLERLVKALGALIPDAPDRSVP